MSSHPDLFLSFTSASPLPLSFPDLGAHAVDREHRVMTALGRYGATDSTLNIPVPTTLLYCSDSEVIGTPFFCYEYVAGRFYKSPQMETVR